MPALVRLEIFAMESSIQTGAVVFVRDLQKMVDFYAEVIGLHRAREADDYALLEWGSYQLVVHKLPDHLAGGGFAPSELVIREDCALKLVFFVDSLDDAREAAIRRGGLLHGGERVWEFDGTLVCDGCDPEGNVIQLRQYKPD
jgi:predicted enzyme related to lactoylglutathione lyase